MNNFDQLNKKERRELKQQQKAHMQKRRAQKRTSQKVLIWLAVVAVVGFVGWWGITNVDFGNAVPSASSSTGAIAPDFRLPSTTEETIVLSGFRGKKNVLLYFHEGLSCDPCIQQTPELEKRLDEFEKLNVALLNIALDPVEEQRQVVERYGIRTPMLSYDAAKTEVDYDLTRFSMGMGRRAGHTFVLVGTDGAIKWRKDYWPGRGHMVRGGTMFVASDEIVAEVKSVLEQ